MGGVFKKSKFFFDNILISSKSSLLLSLNSKMEQLIGEITTDERNLKAATENHAKEASNFAALEKESTDIIDTLNCTIALLDRYASMIEGQEEDIAAWTGDQKAETKAQGLDRNTNSLICATCKREPLNSVMVTEIFLDFANFGVRFWDPCSFECYQPSG